MTNKLKDNYEIRLRCATCGCEDQFEFNEDKSCIKCTFCNREYFGGIEELKELNQETCFLIPNSGYKDNHKNNLSNDRFGLNESYLFPKKNHAVKFYCQNLTFKKRSK